MCSTYDTHVEAHIEINILTEIEEVPILLL